MTKTKKKIAPKIPSGNPHHIIGILYPYGYDPILLTSHIPPNARRKTPSPIQIHLIGCMRYIFDRERPHTPPYKGDLENTSMHETHAP